MKPTIYDVAKKAGVSIATVSKVINNTGRISEERRKMVMKVMEELDYQPSSVAAALTGKKTYTIGVLIPDIANPFIAEVARALENEARETGYTIILCSTDYQLEREHDYLELLLKKQVDGIIIATEPKDIEVYEKLNKRKIPHLFFSVEPPSFLSNVVTVDDVRGGYLVGQYLLAKGHLDVALIAEPNRSSGRLRVEGFMQSLKEAGVTFNEKWLIHSKSKVDEARIAAQEVLNLKKRPTALFAGTDLIATIFVNEARKTGVRIPEDISVIGFDNTVHAELADPGLTTIAQPISELAYYAIHNLLKSIENPNTPGHRVILMPELIERQSVKRIDS
ncbi:LacI family DNA-binding transcriptional regulator [Halalkalibacter kiskunsagensis]|uniref:LacI family DNA-binding transcriptional regulator n=1 Tax=Halalkalibacter kiskunsagensis TaxID=1548599 RepID=A0ABV6K6X2_9BACI